MGFFKNLISKFPCELCGKEVGVISRSKLKDDKYICYDCTKNCSHFYPETIHTLEEVKEHMEYMKNMDSFCKDVFDKDETKLDFALMFAAVGIKFSDKLGMFEIISNDTKKQNYRELFRYDQIFDYKLYGKQNTGENPTKKYLETGIIIKMLSKRDTSLNMTLTNRYDDYKHEYVTEFTIPCAKSTDVLDGGLILKHLDEIFGIAHNGNSGRTEFRKIDDIEMYFKRDHWREVADEAEKAYFGKLVRE